MFNLETAIANWRRQMLAAGIQTPVPLEELESHLRDEVEQLGQSGTSPSQAFATAVQRLGRANALRREFKKSERTFMKRTLLVLFGIFGVLCGTAFILPAMAWYRDHNAMPAAQLGFLLLGMAITAVGLGTAIYGFKKRSA